MKDQVMSADKIDIPYFNFFVEPCCFEKAANALDMVVDGQLYFQMLKHLHGDVAIIKKGTHLFDYIPPIKEADDEDDVIIGGNQEKEIHYKIDVNSKFQRKDDSYFSTTHGVLIIAKNIIRFIPISPNGLCDIKISADNSQAIATFYPPHKGGNPTNEDEIIKKIRSLKIQVRPDLDLIRNTLEIVSQTGQIMESVLIASGKSPKPGIEGWLEFHFNIEHKSAPVVDEDGHIDFYNLNLLESVTKDQLIVTVHPSVQGEEGMDLFGKPIIPANLKDIVPPKAKNLVQSEDDPNKYLSTIDGYITYKNNNIIITNLYNIRGDVDFHTGNIISKGSLSVVGNVKSGFKLQMSENIKIGGYVKDAQIETEGEVIINGGFSGNGEGIIRAGGNITVRYVRNQTLYSQGDIIVDKEVVDAKLFAKGEIKGLADRMLIIGGYAIAGSDVTLKNLGHEYELPTKIELGFDYTLKDRIKDIEIKMQNILPDLTKRQTNIENMAAKKTAAPGFKTFLQKAIEDYKKLKEVYVKLKEQKTILQKEITDPSGAKLMVKGKIFPGVEIIIDSHHLKISEVLSRKVFYYSPNEEGIVISDLT